MSNKSDNQHCDKPGLMDIEQALEVIFDTIQPISQTELIDISAASLRVLATDIVSPINVPPADNSAMDGYAVRSKDFLMSNDATSAVDGHSIGEKTLFTQIGTAFAGAPFDGELKATQCVRIMTGGLIPQGADAVIMQENAVPIAPSSSDSHQQSPSNPLIRFNTTPPKGLAVRKQGEDIRKNQAMYSKGALLQPIDIGVLSSLGIPQVSVYKKLKVGVISTGDELRQPGEELAAGQIYDSNRPTLIAMLNAYNIDVVNYGVVKDDKKALEHAFVKASEQVDIMLTSGGVSVGDADYTQMILAEYGQVAFWKIAMKPGKPLAFGRFGQAVFIGLPGNPVSSVVTFQQIALPAIRFFSGMTRLPAIKYKALAAKSFRKRAGRTDFQRAIVFSDSNGRLNVEPVGKQNSGILSTMTQANCYAILEKDRSDVDAGEIVDVQYFTDI